MLVSPVVPSADVLAVDTRGTLRVIDRSGHTARRLPRRLRGQPQAVELAPDRRHAFISLWRPDAPPQLLAFDLAHGTSRQLANGISPALSPDKTRLAFVVAQGDTNGKWLTALAIRTLRTGSTRTIPLTPTAPLGTPPELVLNWSPDGHRLVFFNSTQVTIVDVARTTPVPTRSPPTTSSMFAPVFLTPTSLVVEEHCCIGRQTLAVVDLRLRKKYVFATVSSPVEQVRRIGPGRLLVVTALHELDVITRGHVRVIGHAIVAAAP